MPVTSATRGAASGSPGRALIVAAAVGTSAVAAAHPVATASAAGPFAWTVEPWVVACLVASGALYALGFVRLARQAGLGRAVHARRALAFAGAWCVTAVALVGPLDAFSAQLFSAHMVQHEALMVVAAPLFVLGKPLGVWAWALPPAGRRVLGRFFHRPGWRRPWLLVTAPVAAWVIHALALWLWHIPSWFDAALANDAIHALQHASFLFAALLYWWSVLRGRRHRGAAMASLFTTMLHTGALGALLALSPVPWYAPYAGRTLAFGIDPLEDQQLGGLVMWIPAGLAYVAVGLTIAARWLQPHDRAHDAARALSSREISPNEWIAIRQRSQ